MSTDRLRRGLWLGVLASLAVSANASGQGLSLDLSAGRVVYQPVTAKVESNSVMGTLRYEAPVGAWVYGALGVPLRSDLSWGGAGAGGRFLSRGAEGRGASVGVDLGGHAFLFRDAVASRRGEGTTVDALPFVRMASGAASVELRGGWRGQTLTTSGIAERRGVFETGARAGYGSSVRVDADVRWVRAEGVTYPFAGGTLTYSGTLVQAWVQAGSWLSAELDDASWGAGVAVAVGQRATLWLNARQEAPDPLYWNTARRSWSAGVTRRLGGGTPRRLFAPREVAGGVVIEVAASDAPGGDLVVAGDFSEWRPVAMRREGGRWTVRLSLAPGVYHYAFRSGSGDWFVPVSTAGRRSDGMGGYVALLVVG